MVLYVHDEIGERMLAVAVLELTYSALGLPHLLSVPWSLFQRKGSLA
ncbi:MAG: hypothetical protein WCC37_22830 [Candidatus Sulfotelmatobacter sp.]